MFIHCKKAKLNFYVGIIFLLALPILNLICSQDLKKLKIPPYLAENYSNFRMEEQSIQSNIKQDLLKSRINISNATINTQQVKYIYFVTRDFYKRFGKKKLLYSSNYFKERCGMINKTCVVSLDSEYLGPGNVDKFDAVVFRIRHFGKDIIAKKAVPYKRSPFQRYVLSTREAPRDELQPRFVNERFMSINFYNWTMHFRNDADIVVSYGPDFVKKGQKPPYEFATTHKSPNQAGLSLQTKTKAAYWVASHCPTDNRREDYVRTLQRYLQVDIYGKCGNLTCPYQKQRNPCEDDMSKNYYFYLAFENSNCLDYITEKFWRLINHPVVPVVMGGADYKKDTPPHSYIDVNDFPDVESLANYLKFLMTNPKKYLEYFKWRKDYVIYRRDEFCKLCEKLHDNSESIKMYKNMTAWFYYDKEGKKLCTDGSERKYYKSILF